MEQNKLNKNIITECQFTNAYYSIKGSDDILWLISDDDPHVEIHPNGGFRYNIIKTDGINFEDYIDDVKRYGSSEVFWDIIEERTTEWGYIDCNEHGKAFLGDIQGIEIDDCLCAYDTLHDSIYGDEGYINALYKIGKEEIASAFSDILCEDIKIDEPELNDDER